MDRIVDYLPLKWIEQNIGKELPIKGGSGLSKSDPLVLSGVHRAEIPTVEQMILKQTLMKHQLIMTSYKQSLMQKNGRDIEEVTADGFSISGDHQRELNPLTIYFDISEPMSD